MLRPVTATLRPWRLAMLRMDWMRYILEAKVVMMIRLSQPRNCRSMPSVTTDSEGV